MVPMEDLKEDDRDVEGTKFNVTSEQEIWVNRQPVSDLERAESVFPPQRTTLPVIGKRSSGLSPDDCSSALAPSTHALCICGHEAANSGNLVRR